jgi:hypothetical protein
MTATHPHRRAGGDSGIDQPGLRRWFRVRAGLTILRLIPADSAALLVNTKVDTRGGHRERLPAPPRPDPVRSRFRREHPQESGLRALPHAHPWRDESPRGIDSWTVTRWSSQSLVHDNWNSRFS